MSDEETTVPTSEPAPTPTIAPVETVETEAELPQDIAAEETAQETPEQPPEDAEPPEIEYVTIERNGKAYQIPKELEGELLMQSDYTKKTQSVAERAKELDAREAGIAQQLEATEEELRDRALVLQAKAELDQYAAVDWVKLSQEDPYAFQQHQARYQMLQREYDKTNAALTTKQTERTQAAERDLATRIEQTIQFAQKEIPGWKPELTETLVKHALEAGVPEAELKRVWSPAVYKLLHQAHIGLLAMQKPATKPVAPPAAPLTKVTGKATPATSRTLAEVADSGDMDEYVAMRKAGRVR